MSFWERYLADHRDPTNRLLHAVGTIVGATVALQGIGRASPRRFVAGLAIGYGMAWAGHLVFEKNRPATLDAPLESFVSDWRMLYLTLTGQADAELAAHGLADRGAHVRPDSS